MRQNSAMEKQLEPRDIMSNTPGFERRIPGEIGIWILIFGDMLIFSSLFCVFLLARSTEGAIFTQSARYMNQTLGVINTFLMLTSSWLVATAVHAVRSNRLRAGSLCLMMAFICGVGFVIVKYFEYSEKIDAGILLSTDTFFMYYFILTGIHLLHVVIGLGVLAFLSKVAWTHKGDDNIVVAMENGATFWHLVDLLWIVLFALLYLLR